MEKNSTIMALKVRNGGVRRYQNKDGSYTAKGEGRYSSNDHAKPKNAFSLKATAHRVAAGYNSAQQKYYGKEAKREAFMEYANKSIKNDNLRKGGLHKLNAKVYGVNENFYKNAKEFDQLMSDSYKDAKYKHLNKANEAQAAANAKRDAKLAAKQAKQNAIKQSVKDYSKSYDKWNKMAEQADTEWDITKSMYKDLAKTPIGRVREVMKAQRGKGSKLANDYIKQFDKASEMQDSADDFWRSDTMIKRKKTGRNSVERLLNNVRYDR